MQRPEKMVASTLGNFYPRVMHLSFTRTDVAWWQHLRFPHHGECESVGRVTVHKSEGDSVCDCK